MIFQGGSGPPVPPLDPHLPQREKTCLLGFANNKGADQPAHTHSLISAFVIRFLESTISKLAKSEISIFYLVPVAEQAGLNLKTGFVVTRPIYYAQATHSRTGCRISRGYDPSSFVAIPIGP